LQVIPTGIEHNAHMFYIKLRSFNERKSIMEYLESYGIQTAFHYIPLHSSKYCKDYYSFYGRDEYTTKESERLLRLPMYNDLHTNDVNYICSVINKYYYG